VRDVRAREDEERTIDALILEGQRLETTLAQVDVRQALRTLSRRSQHGGGLIDAHDCSQVRCQRRRRLPGATSEVRNIPLARQQRKKGGLGKGITVELLPQPVPLSRRPGKE